MIVSSTNLGQRGWAWANVVFNVGPQPLPYKNRGAGSAGPTCPTFWALLNHIVGVATRLTWLHTHKNTNLLFILKKGWAGWPGWPSNRANRLFNRVSAMGQPCEFLAQRSAKVGPLALCPSAANRRTTQTPAHQTLAHKENLNMTNLPQFAPARVTPGVTKFGAASCRDGNAADVAVIRSRLYQPARSVERRSALPRSAALLLIAASQLAGRRAHTPTMGPTLAQLALAILYFNWPKPAHPYPRDPAPRNQRLQQRRKFSTEDCAHGH
jgi:hypothetical protein